MNRDGCDQIDVLIYAPVIGRGGVRRLVLRLLHTWIKIAEPTRWSFKVLGQRTDEDGRAIPWPEGTFIPLQDDKQPNVTGAKLLDYLQSSQDYFFQRLRVSAKDSQIIWLPQPWWSLRLVNEIVDLPAHIVPTVHDFAFDELAWSGPFGDRFRDEAVAFVGASSKLVFSSRYTMRSAVTRYGMPTEQGEVIYLADFVPESFRPTAEEAQRATEHYRLPRNYWLAFHATGHKDPLTILEAIAKIKSRRPELAKPLVIAGMNTDQMIPGSRSYDAYSDLIKRRVNELGLEYQRDFFVLGFVDDAYVGGLYHGAFGCITASKSEAGLSGTVFEAFRAKTPLVHSDIGPFVERLGINGTYGLHFRVGDSDDLVRAMIDHSEDAESRAARVDAASQFASSRSWEDVGREYLDLFSKLAKQGPSTRRWRPPNGAVATHSEKSKRFHVPKFLERMLRKLTS